MICQKTLQGWAPLMKATELDDAVTRSDVAWKIQRAEALESADPADWLVGMQFHPERPEFTGPEFERLRRAFVSAAADFVRSGRQRRS